MSDNLKSRTVRGLKWSSLDGIFQQGFQVISGIALARILFPEDFGIIGVLTVFIALAVMLQDGGFGIALIRKKDVSKDELNSVFYVSFLISILVYLCLFFIAPYIADFYEKPILKNISRFLFLSFVFASLGTIPNVILTRKLDYKSIALTSFISLSISLILSISFAIKGLGVWALCMQTVSYHFSRVVFLWIFSRWTPLLKISLAPLKQLVGFSSKVLISNILNAIVVNITPSIIGKLYDFNQSGLYSQASRWYLKPVSFFTSPILSLSVPVLSSLNEEMERQKRIFRKMIKTIAFIAFPITFFFVYVCPEFVVIAIKPKWIACVPYLQLLCLGAIFSPIETLFWNLITSRGKSGVLFIFILVKNLLILTALLCSIKFGIIVLLINFAIVNYLFLMVEATYTIKFINYKLKEFLWDTIPYLLISGLIVGVMYPFFNSISNLWISLITKFGIATIVYLAIMYFAKSEIMMEGVNYALRVMRKKNLIRKN